MSLTVDSVIQSFQPGFIDYADNDQFHHWMDYACELDELTLLNYNEGQDALVLHLNKTMLDYPSGHSKNHACVDVASTLESLLPQYKGLFKYV